MRRTIRFAAALLAASVAIPTAASAQFTIYTGVTGGFVSNSTTAGFNAAVGGAADEHRDLSTDMLGNPLGSTANGLTLSPNFHMRTRSSSYGGITGTLLNAAGSGGNSEVGPYNSWDGTLVIDFLSAGQLASAVGFGMVEFDGAGTLSFFDQTGALAYSVASSSISSTDFDFWGAVATGSQRISRVELDGSFYAIQDISASYDVTATPEPASFVLFGSGLAALAFVRRRRKA